MRIVNAGMLGSSMLDTEALTSGKGLPSSSIVLRSNSGRKRRDCGGLAMRLTWKIEKEGNEECIGLMKKKLGAVNHDMASEPQASSLSQI